MVVGFFVCLPLTVNAADGWLAVRSDLACTWDNDAKGSGRTEWGNASTPRTGKAKPSLYLWYNNTWVRVKNSEDSHTGTSGNVKVDVTFSGGYSFYVATTHYYSGASPQYWYTSTPSKWCG